VVSDGRLRRLHSVLLGLGMLALLVGLWAALARLGFVGPAAPALAGAHGPLMVAGFLGTVISLERAAALGRRWGYSAPFLCGIGALAFVGGLSPDVGTVLILAGSLALLGIVVAILRHPIGLDALTMLVGVLAWIVGNLFWLRDKAIPTVVPWWMAFLVLTIGGGAT
jgi:hypothetical protein